MARAYVLADTSIWIDHIAGKSTPLLDLLNARRVATHPLVVGEIAMGSLKNRKFFLDELQELPTVHVAGNSEVLAMVEWLGLFGTGIGFVDAHLLAGARMTDNVILLTKDRRLGEQAQRLGVVYAP